MKKRILCLLSAVLLLLSLFPFQAFADTQISSIRINGLNYPNPNTPFSQYNAFTTSDQGIHFYNIDWYDLTDERFLEGNDVFQAGHEYEVQIWVEAKAGYSFQCVNDYTPNVTATIDGYTMEVSKAYEYKAFAMVVLSYCFSYLPQKSWIKTLDLKVPAPVTGEKASYTQISTGEYATGNVYFSGQTDPNMVNGISWYDETNGGQLNPNNPVFAANTVYEFHCLVFPEEGYRIADNAKVTVNGKRASARLDYDMFLSVSYEFPKTDASAAHTHTYTEWRYNSGEHYKYCTICSEMFFTESHKGGNATCQEDGTCSVCGYAYEKASEDLHVPDTGKWIARGSSYHFHKCTLCGAHCDIEDHRWSPRYHTVDASGHAYICADCKAYSEIVPHVAGPAGTPDTDVLCKDCGYVIKPAANHTHKMTAVAQQEATCTQPGTKAYYTCSDCHKDYEDEKGERVIESKEDLVIPPLGHSVSDQWEHDEKNHWRVCTVCDEKMTETEMVHEMKGRKCTTCTYKKSVGSKETEPEESDEPEKSEPSEEAAAGPQWWVILIIGLCTVAFGIGAGFAVTGIKKKK